jgi:hypothetical protein
MISALSMLFGGLLRALPELMHYMNRKADDSHELAMMDKQMEMARLNKDAAHEAMDSQQILALLDAQKYALEGQFQKTGFRLVDALNFLVRPIFAYWSLALYTVFKLSELRAAWPNVGAVYTEADFALLGGIASFYFVGRSFDKAKK